MVLHCAVANTVTKVQQSAGPAVRSNITRAEMPPPEFINDRQPKGTLKLCGRARTVAFDVASAPTNTIGGWALSRGRPYHILIFQEDRALKTGGHRKACAGGQGEGMDELRGRWHKGVWNRKEWRIDALKLETPRGLVSYINS